MLLADAQVDHFGVHVDLEAELGHQGAGPAGHGVPVEQAPAGRLVAEEDVFSDGHVFDEGQLLVDDADTGGLGIARGVEADGLAVEQDLAGEAAVGVDAGEDFDQGGFAGAVFADEGVDFAGANIEGDAVERTHTGEFLDDVPGFEKRRRGWDDTWREWLADHFNPYPSP